MTFYISEFCCGVLFTVLLELAALIFAAAVSAKKDKKKKKYKAGEAGGAVGTYDCNGE